MTITANDLPQILADHGKWLRDEEGGRRADLRDADLRDYPIERRPTVIAEIERRVAAFWASIREGKEQPIDGQTPGGRVGAVR